MEKIKFSLRPIFVEHKDYTIIYYTKNGIYELLNFIEDIRHEIKRNYGNTENILRNVKIGVGRNPLESRAKVNILEFVQTVWEDNRKLTIKELQDKKTNFYIKYINYMIEENTSILKKETTDNNLKLIDICEI